ncbi:MAG: exopolysaccharide biosynthesis polyprenyl glycosylphosphotransferase [Lachnospiraceae bacterium]|nr:exopolysaccharide biosynthesis polyprenyl glycosylphosphotransferase [Lachnospiraceae bacterium]
MEDKRISNRANGCLVIWNIGLFALVWFLYYNRYTFDTYLLQGGILSVVIFCVIYYAISSVYSAHRIASVQIGETVFSQVVSFGIADLVLYIECCLIHNRMVNLMPGVIAVFLQIIGTMCIVTIAKRYLMKHIPPQKTVFVYGKDISKEEILSFKERILKKYEHLFDVQNMVSETIDKEQLHQYIHECETVLFYEVSRENRAGLIEEAMRDEKSIYLTPRLSDVILMGCEPRHLLDTPLLRYGYAYQKKSLHGSKRMFDLIFSIVLLVVASPIMLITAIAIKIEDNGPVFYKQARCTKDGKVFDILKFRSMIVDAEKNGSIPCTEGDPRITKVGKIIRATRLDELPQIINILKGEMSFVGPRPERVEHVEQFTKELPEFAYRMRVKGGLTGYAQIYGKYNTSAYDKLRLDLMYIENQSFLLDLKLLMLTFKIMFTPESTEGFTEEKSQELAVESQANEN